MSQESNQKNKSDALDLLDGLHRSFDNNKPGYLDEEGLNALNKIWKLNLERSKSLLSKLKK